MSAVQWPAEVIQFLSETTPVERGRRKPSHIQWRKVVIRQEYDSNSLIMTGRKIPWPRDFFLDSNGRKFDGEIHRAWRSRRARKQETKFTRKESIQYKRIKDKHQLLTWKAQGYRSLEWTTCGGWIWGPSKGEWKDYPTSKCTRQREARQEKRTKQCRICKGAGWVDGNEEHTKQGYLLPQRFQCRGCLPRTQWYERREPNDLGRIADETIRRYEVKRLLRAKKKAKNS